MDEVVMLCGCAGEAVDDGIRYCPRHEALEIGDEYVTAAVGPPIRLETPSIRTGAALCTVLMCFDRVYPGCTVRYAVYRRG